MNNLSEETFFSSGLAPEELEEILQQIDLNLNARPLLQKNKTIANPEELYILSAPPAMQDYLALINEIRNARAPYYVVNGNIFSKLIKITHNFVVKIFGRKQAYYNELTINLLQSIAGDLQLYQAYSMNQTALINVLSRELRAMRDRQIEMEHEQLLAVNDREFKKKAVQRKTK